MTDVSCALITQVNGQVLVTQRSAAMRLPLKWEFPGGKIEEGETAQDCIVREILEELALEVQVVQRMRSHVFGEGNNAICLVPFLCIIIAGEIKLAEHAAFQWLLPEELMELDWAEADIPVLHDYLNSL